ncbi:MAG: hypothetical protein QXV28_09135, partial [Ignisphaera sp.]
LYKRCTTTPRITNKTIARMAETTRVLLGIEIAYRYLIAVPRIITINSSPKSGERVPDPSAAQCEGQHIPGWSF